ncbi:hypothetical protein [Mycolicibacterium aubagnense]|uniref:Uncharacterized protein n=1 Tax=Mycolicibacterium aubagnense TaxID=319707 RepID=A0ABN5YP59_9MYCO|nr:hypothetical protein [Mycolicibacterium aubagnense]BBX82740.1 hypothetical protein MAUB_06130 [Mycolicibacterium aubagnense]
MGTVIAMASHGRTVVGSNRYTPASASAMVTNTQVNQVVPNMTAIRVAAPRINMAQIVATVPTNPAATIAHT